MPVFKNGTHVNGTDYKRIRISAGPQRGKYVDQLILEAKLGRPIRPGYTVEHCNGNSLDIRPENLIEVTAEQNVILMHKRRKKAQRLIEDFSYQDHNEDFS